MQPLADKLRPKNLAEFVGHEKLVGSNGIIKKLLEVSKQNSFFPSLVFWGPPGVGKTTLARIISNELDTPFYEFSAVNTSVKTIEKQIQMETSSASAPDLWSEKSKTKSKTPVVFIDEIHRFNKAQQDALLPLVEQGTIIFIGATTENPSFEIIGPLLSRCRVVVLDQLSQEELKKIVQNAVSQTDAKISDDALEILVNTGNGDARACLNVLEIATNLSNGGKISVETLKDALQRHNLSFDLQGEEFYNTMSALHKSIRGSDPNAALYYVARMLEAGQDPLYIARRLIRAASEDVGLKDPQALVLAVAAFQACERIGPPECNLAVAEAAVYLAKSPKSNELYIAYGKAAEDVKTHGNLPIPMHIRNAPTKLMKDLGYGKDYNYYHSPKGEKLEGVEYLPDKLKDKKYFH